METFASSFSDRLKRIALENRPPSTDLTLKQITILSDLAGYRLKNHKGFPAGFTLYHPDGLHSIDDGLYLNWDVLVDSWNLIYYPTLQYHCWRGDKYHIVDQMLNLLSHFLPNLGYQKKIVVPLEEEAITLPNELCSDTGVRIMFKSEFQKRYQSLYSFLKEKMTPDR